MHVNDIKDADPASKFYASFGEIMLRLSPPDHERFLQSPHLDACFGGGESNVLISLAIQGLKTRFITALPYNDIGIAAKRTLQGFGVDVSNIILRPDSRIGIYFMEKGANQRASRVIYDRNFSAIHFLEDGEIDWGEPSLIVVGFI